MTHCWRTTHSRTALPMAMMYISHESSAEAATAMVAEVEYVASVVRHSSSRSQTWPSWLQVVVVVVVVEDVVYQ